MEPSKLPDSIFDKELTRKSGLLDLPDSGDSVMADHGYDIEQHSSGAVMSLILLLGRLDSLLSRDWN